MNSTVVYPKSGQGCRQCHARISAAANLAVCPACGGQLAPLPGSGLEDASPAEVDHRGIVLPRRHAVGGIITPR